MTEKQIGPTIYGVETEYSCMVTLPNDVTHELVGACHSNDVGLGLYQEPKNVGMKQIHEIAINQILSEMGIFRNPHGLLSNGGRFYEDPSGFEYCTPETRTAEDATQRSFDGDKILIGVLRRLQEDEIILSFQANRRCVDHNRSSRGVHLNTSTNLVSPPDKKIIKGLQTLNVIKGALFGSGGLLLDESGNTNFHHSPRLSITDQDGTKTPSWTSRSLVRYPFKTDSGCKRIETITSDALSFAWPMRASLVLTNAAIKLLELGSYDAFPNLRNPLRAANVVGRSGNKNLISIESVTGEYQGVRPTEILRSISEIALLTHETEDILDQESIQVLNEIIMVSDLVEKDPFSAAPYVESIARLLAMQQKMDQSGASLASEKMCKFDYYWDKLDGGLAEQLRERGKAGWLGFSNRYEPRKTAQRILSPPQDTRAKLRAQIIKDSKGKRDCDWHKIIYENGQDLYLDTLQTESETPI
jgi:hypothetical protein